MKAVAVITHTIRQNIFFRLYKFYIIDSILIVKRQGFKSLIRERGWKVVGVVVGYYLIRDTLLYIVVPYFVARGLF